MHSSGGGCSGLVEVQASWLLGYKSVLDWIICNDFWRDRGVCKVSFGYSKDKVEIRKEGFDCTVVIILTFVVFV